MKERKISDAELNKKRSNKLSIGQHLEAGKLHPHKTTLFVNLYAVIHRNYLVLDLVLLMHEHAFCASIQISVSHIHSCVVEFPLSLFSSNAFLFNS